MDWPEFATVPNKTILSTVDPTICPAQSVSSATRSSGATSAAWGTANFGKLIVVTVMRPVTALQMAVWNGATAAGNTSVGIYRIHPGSNAFTQLCVSTAAQAGTNTMQVFDIADTLLIPGYYGLALSSSSATSTFFRQQTSALSLAYTMFEMAASHPLPATFTGVNVVSPSYTPILAVDCLTTGL